MMSENSDEISTTTKSIDSQPIVVSDSIDTNDVEKKDDNDWLSVGASWGSSWLKTAKEKTLSTYELVKKDLSEFSDAVQTEATALASATANTVKQQAAQIGHLVNLEDDDNQSNLNLQDSSTIASDKDDAFGMKWMKSLVNTVKGLTQEDTTIGENDSVVPVMANVHNFDSKAAHRLYAIQADIETYIGEPSGATELFDDWLENFSIDERKQDICNLLVSNPAMRSMYSRLVPSELTNVMFWQRYFYKIHQFELDEARRQELLNRSTNLKVKTNWEEDSDDETEHVIETTNQSVDDCTTTSSNACASESIAPPKLPDAQSNSQQPSPDRRSSVSGPVDETWSVCSNKDIDIQEMPEEESPTTDTGPLTPRPSDDAAANAKKTAEWVNWEDE